MTSFKFTAREVITVLKARITSLTLQLEKVRARKIKHENEMRDCIQSQAAKIVQLQTELREKNGVIQSYANANQASGYGAIKQMSNMTMAWGIAARLNSLHLLHPLSFREQVRAVCPDAIGADLNQLADNTPPWVVPIKDAPVPAATWGLQPHEVRAAEDLPPQTRTFTVSEICKVFNVKPEQVVGLAKTIMPATSALPPRPNVLTGTIAPDVLAGARYGEYITVGGFPESTVAAPGPNGYEQFAYYLSKKEADALRLSTSGDIKLHHPVSIDVVNNDAHAQNMVPVIITVMR